MKRYGLCFQAISGFMATAWFDSLSERRQFATDFETAFLWFQFIDQDITARVSPVGSKNEPGNIPA